MWDIPTRYRVPMLKILKIEKIQNCCFCVRNGIFDTKYYFFMILAEMFLLDFRSLNLKTHLSSDAYEKIVSTFI